MNNRKPIQIVLFFTIASIMMLGIFSVIIRRGTAMFNLYSKPETILLLAVGMVAIMIISMLLSSFGGKKSEIIGVILLRGIYGTRVVIPIMIIRDSIAIRYNIPPFFMAILAVTWLGYGIYKGTSIKVTPLTIISDRVNKEHKFVFICDIHADAIRNHTYIQSIVNTIKNLQPDFVLIGGDLMNSAKISNVSAFLPFNQLKIPIYAVLGNHDHMGDKEALSQIFGKANIIALRNQSIQKDGLQIVGIDDKSYRGKKKLPEILEECNIIENGKFTILISHQPQKLSKLAKHSIDLELAGHTHNGQLIPFSWIIRIFNDYAYGKYHYKKMTAFISQGIGTRGAPIRTGTQSELVSISLKST